MYINTQDLDLESEWSGNYVGSVVKNVWIGAGLQALHSMLVANSGSRGRQQLSVLNVSRRLLCLFETQMCLPLRSHNLLGIQNKGVQLL